MIKKYSILQEENHIDPSMFTQGYCAEYALALHNTTGFSIFVFEEREEEQDPFDDFVSWQFIHYVVKHPSGKYLDIRGLRTEEDILQNLLSFDGSPVNRDMVRVRETTPEEVEAEAFLNEDALRLAEKYVKDNYPTTKAQGASILKNREAPIRTHSGSPIKRSKYGVGKDMDHRIYLHKDYALDVVPPEIWKRSLALLKEQNPSFKYKTIMFFPKQNKLRFDEAPDFDTAREPIPGSMVTVDYVENTVGKPKSSDSIWHHKWLWVKDDYSGFDVQKAKDWSRLWTSKLKETASGRKLIWKGQLERVGLK